MWKRPVAAYFIIIVASIAAGALLSPWAQAAEQADGAPRAIDPAPALPVTIAAEMPAERTADAVMIMACAALALLMTPALGLFYGGMVRRKNVLSAFQQAFILLGIVPI